MGLKRDTLEWQLSRATTELTTFESELDAKGVVTAARPRSPKWRNLNATCRQLRRRLLAVAKIEATNVEVAQRKAANSNEAVAAS